MEQLGNDDNQSERRKYTEIPASSEQISDMMEVAMLLVDAYGDETRLSGYDIPAAGQNDEHLGTMSIKYASYRSNQESAETGSISFFGPELRDDEPPLLRIDFEGNACYVNEKSLRADTAPQVQELCMQLVMTRTLQPQEQQLALFALGRMADNLYGYHTEPNLTTTSPDGTLKPMVESIRDLIRMRNKGNLIRRYFESEPTESQHGNSLQIIWHKISDSPEDNHLPMLEVSIANPDIRTSISLIIPRIDNAYVIENDPILGRNELPVPSLHHIERISRELTNRLKTREIREWPDPSINIGSEEYFDQTEDYIDVLAEELEEAYKACLAAPLDQELWQELQDCRESLEASFCSSFHLINGLYDKTRDTHKTHEMLSQRAIGDWHGRLPRNALLLSLYVFHPDQESIPDGAIPFSREPVVFLFNRILLEDKEDEDGDIDTHPLMTGYVIKQGALVPQTYSFKEFQVIGFGAHNS